jgi:membrane protease YdiL (CAAX protease family)
MESISPSVEERPVSWTGFDVFMIFCFWIALTQIGIGFLLYFFTEPITVAVTAATQEHPLSQLLEQGKNSLLILFVAFFTGVIIAPLTEEFLFRLLFQGWLSKFFQQVLLKKLKHSLLVSFLSGVFPIVLVSTIFAAAHGGKRMTQPVDVQFYSILGVGIVDMLIFCFGVVFLRITYGVTLSEIGFRVNRIFSDIFVAVLTFLWSTPFILGLHALLRNSFPDRNTDPVPLFIFSIILGVLYYRSGRIQLCFVLHALLNGFSFLLPFWEY